MIVLLEPRRAPGFVSGGYRYQDEILRRLAARSEGRQRAIAPDELASTVAALRREDPEALVVVDGLFHALTRQPLPAGTIALLHAAPQSAAWAEAPLHTIATSQATADAVRGSARSVAVVRPGLDSCFVPAAGTAPHDRTRLLCIGTIGPGKGQLLLVESVAQRAELRERSEVVLVGDDRAHPDYVARVRTAARGVPLRVAGCVPPPAVARELQAADLLVSASRQESFGMAVAEAAACGVPVFAFAAGEIETFVLDGRNGWLVAPHASDRAFAVRLGEVLLQADVLAAARAKATRPAMDDWDAVAAKFRDACLGATRGPM